MKINSEKILRFIRSLENEGEVQFLEHTLTLRKSIRDVIIKNKISKTEVCVHFGIEEKDYDDFIQGAWHYSIETMAALNALWIACEQRKLQKNVPVKI